MITFDKRMVKINIRILEGYDLTRASDGTQRECTRGQMATWQIPG